ncbi:MAG: Chromosome partition protein Smc [Parcubacteria group bacterium GW2011_GWD2_43_10]|uniref:RecF/RecN/SMC N-terminal domain-containing protein n=1 Tax=Candidatus Veblenbacteria bacterium RIFOXYA2_FULL_43_9 TaxID=1802425 RepID=A0A1G2Q3B6_9BACT|nr:MAG: Chromosome partition protein Smc [Parcubacteria group bacterium GW2011_GWA2_42_80]KKS81700.1 MAG: Chromosome partition protein Smc [Parcubacteria group bacterium GW2011_GWD2_43_10]KKT14371.1 MAG: Chromosome partition protein Smc [Parcubacteria group bacterium GW2011_GWF2_43_38]KKT16567.1 MAG: Chromosome partition protein Smc [Parcubacteria group bacterium GW2011_GWB1_43_66]OHA55054.1 MAG: hypothetical protein A2226_01020 [Candidatus Veblenbacteria bacterium RIFOXYA2_FULL_43_9]HAO81144.
MYLQKLEIQGFKSFAHKTTLEFNRELTAIVGPNGSGKSNIADSIRWVLGEQSIKLLRGKRAEDVIFAGSDLKSRLGMAEVSLHLNNEDGQAPIDFSEIVVTRRVFRDGQSEYLLNGAGVRLQDIQLLLAQANFGQKTYSVIGQGMVDSILVSSPAERKEFFEEATGVKQYQIKREQSIAKLLATFENLDQASVVMAEIEPRLRSLTRQVKRLERREELEREVSELQKLYYRFRWHELESRRLQVAERVSGLNKSLAKQNQSAQELQNKLVELEQKGATPDSWQQLETRQSNLRNRIAELVRQQALEQAKAQVGHIAKGQGEIAILRQQQSEISEELKNVADKLTAVGREIISQQEALTEAAANQAKIATSFSRFQLGGYPWLEQELESVVAEQAELKQSLVSATSLSQIKELVGKFTQLEEKLKILLKRLKQSGQMSLTDLDRLMKEREVSVGQVAEIKANHKSLEREQLSLKERQEQLTRSLERVKNELGDKAEVTDKTKTNVTEDLVRAEAELKEVTNSIAAYQSESQGRQAQVFKWQRELNTAREEERRLEQDTHEAALELTRLETKLEDLDREMAQEVSPELVRVIKEAGEVKSLVEGETALELQRLKHQLELTGGIEPEVVSEYQQTKTRYDFLAEQMDDLQTATASLESIIRDLDATIEKKFLVSFKEINEKFTQYFKVLFDGGKAQLVLQRADTHKEEVELLPEDEEATLADKSAPSAKEKFLATEKIKASFFSGVEISATPPGKKLSTINALSGGERALTSIALICSIISNNPSPFVVLDEVDAALDEANSERYAAILDSLMDKTQFITVTHNRATMRRASILYGVTIGEDGVSKLLSVKFAEADELAIKNSKSKGKE